MIQLNILRHGNAPMGGGQFSDFERVLDGYGQEQVQHSSKLILLKSPDLGKIIASPAKRCFMTTQILCELGNQKIDQVEWIPSIYNSSLSNLISIIESQTNPIITIVGHNPGLSELASYCTGGYVGLPTAGAISIQFELDDWNLITRGEGRQI